MPAMKVMIAWYDLHLETKRKNVINVKNGNKIAFLCTVIP